MKKDKEWLRTVVKKERNIARELYAEDVYNIILGLIDQLDEPEKLNFNDLHSGNIELVKEKLDSYGLVVTDKPAIPQFVADFIETNKDAYNLYGAYLKLNTGPVASWVFRKSNSDLFSRAWLDGYKVEKEPQWIVKIGKGYFSGYDELKITYVLDDQPGSTVHAIKYTDRDEAESDADDIGGTVEEWSEC